VDTIRIVFSDPMDIPPMLADGTIVDAVELVHYVTGPLELDASEFSYDGPSQALTWTGPAPLAGGAYELRLDGSLLSNVDGSPLYGGTGGNTSFQLQVFDIEQNVQAGGADLAVDSYSVPALADWNNDGAPDLVVGEKTAAGQGKVRVYLNTGSAASPVLDTYFYAQSDGADLVVPASGCLGAFPAVHDWDGDSRKDLIVGMADGRVQLFLNVNSDADPQFGPATFLQVGPAGAKQDINVGSRATLDIVDWNNDGRYDLVMGAMDGKLRLYLNEADSGAADFQGEIVVQGDSGDLVVPSGRSSVRVADLDGDGRKDLVVGNTDGRVLFSANVGSDADPAFAGWQSVLADGVPIDLPGTPRSRPFVGDFNDDQFVDLLVGAEDGLVRLYLGQPNPPGPGQNTLGEPGGVYQYTFQGTVNDPPVADPGGPYTADEGADLPLDGTGSYDPDAGSGDRIVLYEWDLDDDGQFDDAFGAAPTVAWADLADLPHPNRVIPVALRVTDGLGATNVVATALIIGPLEFLEETDLDPAAGPVWYRFHTANAGFLTAEALFDGSPESVTLTLYDEGGETLRTSAPGDGNQRLDWDTQAGTVYLLQASGTHTDVDLRICNMVNLSEGVVNVYGTDEADTFQYAPEGSHRIHVRGVEYRFEDSEVTAVDFSAGAGEDSTTIYGSQVNESLTLYPTQATLERSGMEVTAADCERVVVTGGGGHDVANLHGSAGDDVYAGKPWYGRLVGEGFFARIARFDEIYVDLGEGDDIVRFYDGPGDNSLTADPYQATLNGLKAFHQVEGFRQLHAFADEDGYHTAQLADDPAEDSFGVTFHALGGAHAKLYDGDRLAYPDQTALVFLIRACGFDRTTATAGPGDVGLLFGTGGDDHYLGTPTEGTLTAANGAVFVAAGFEQLLTVAKGGEGDEAELIGSDEKDQLLAKRTSVQLAGADWKHRAVRYDEVTVDAAGGDDEGTVEDSRYTDVFHGTPTGSTYRTGRSDFTLRNFPTTKVVSGGEAGWDEAHLWPASSGDEVVEGTDEWMMDGGTYSIIVQKIMGEVHVHPAGTPSAQQVTPPASAQAVQPAERISDRELALLAHQWIQNQPDSSSEDDDEKEAAKTNVALME
jgi:hypothetical protein